MEMTLKWNYGSMYSEGRQDDHLRSPEDANNPYGFLKFPAGYSVELASIGLKVRGDVRWCCYVAPARGKHTYELNKKVRWADAYDLNNDFPEQEVYTDMIGILKTKMPGLGYAAFLSMTTAQDRVSYINPIVNSAGAGLLLSETFTPEGYRYEQMLYWLGRPRSKVPKHPVPPLKVSISRKLNELGEIKYIKSKGDTDSLLPIEEWAQIAIEMGDDTRPVFIIPHEKEREDVEEVVGEDASIVFITTRGQLAALINDSVGVIATNTAAIQLAHARNKPSIALFSSTDKGRLFVPDAEEKNCVIVSSKTGKLIDIDVEAVKSATKIFERSFALV